MRLLVVQSQLFLDKFGIRKLQDANNEELKTANSGQYLSGSRRPPNDVPLIMNEHRMSIIGIH